jgi:inorganic phosphate transporter, PiT family
MLLVFVLLLVALAFEYINGFLDTANSIATVVATRVLTPREAVIMSAIFNLVGALVGTAVAVTIGNSLVDNHYVTLPTLFCALSGAVIWNLIVWRLGLPSSSSHALIGGLCGATVATAHTHLEVVRWSVIDPVTHVHCGLWPKVLLPMMMAPVIGFSLGFLVMGFLLVALRSWKPHHVNLIFGKSQLLSAAWMSLSHGTNDAQKTMGVIALVLFTATHSGTFDPLPAWLGFLKLPEFAIPVWVKAVCALTMAAGTAVGGMRIIKTVGSKIVRMRLIHGFAAQATAAAVIHAASHWGIPLSTTHITSTSIMGVGATQRLSAVKWGMVSHILTAWVLTLPATSLLGYTLFQMVRGLGLVP